MTVEALEITPPHDETGASIDARRFDPPLVKVRCLWDVDATWAAFETALADVVGSAGGDIERALLHGGVHLGGRPVDPERPPDRVAAGTRVAVYALVREPAALELDPARILVREPGWLAIDKPAWLPMQRTRASARQTVESEVARITGEPGYRAVHRLDRQTSGVALLASDATAASWIQHQLGARTAAKTYLAVVDPAPTEDAFAVEGWIGRVRHPRRFRFGMVSGPGDPGVRARRSASSFRVNQRVGTRALVVAEPVTGRTHQLRVHLSSHGCPIVGDDLYGSAVTGEAGPRVMLHARALRFPREGGGEIEVEARIPSDLRTAIEGATSG